MINSDISKIENDIQKVLYEIIYLQCDSSRINADTRNNLNDALDKKLKVLRNSVRESEKVKQIYSWIVTVGTPLVIALGFVSFWNPATIFGEGVAAAILPLAINLISGISQVFMGSMHVVSTEYNLNVASCREKVEEVMALEHYVTDKNEDNDAKTKNSFEALSNLMKVFNQMITIFGNAVKKELRR